MHAIRVKLPRMMKLKILPKMLWVVCVGVCVVVVVVMCAHIAMLKCFFGMHVCVGSCARVFCRASSCVFVCTHACML